MLLETSEGVQNCMGWQDAAIYGKSVKYQYRSRSEALVLCSTLFNVHSLYRLVELCKGYAHSKHINFYHYHTATVG